MELKKGNKIKIKCSIRKDTYVSLGETQEEYMLALSSTMDEEIVTLGIVKKSHLEKNILTEDGFYRVGRLSEKYVSKNELKQMLAN